MEYKQKYIIILAETEVMRNTIRQKIARILLQQLERMNG